jgi:dTDP-4-amino-4,6-dideoxygalactose transaminase
MSFKDLPLLKNNKKNTVLFYPYISKKSSKNISKILNSRWIGQGPMVDKFEEKFNSMFGGKNYSLATGSGTDALHLSYILSGIKKGDEVISTVFTCTATNIPLLYIGAKIKFADIDPNTMNISIDSVKKLISKKTKAIIIVHYGGLPCEMDELKKLSNKFNIPIIEDAAHALGAKYDNKPIGSISDFTIFSFQAIKHITTGDGGMLIIKDRKKYDLAKRIRWFGINREDKQKGTWENDIKEIGYKYQMTDIGATLGYDSLKEFKKLLNHRRKIFNIYLNEISKNKHIKCINDSCKKKYHAAWLFTIALDKKDFLQRKLRENGIESNQVHFRNDRYSIFKKFCEGIKFKNMDYLENKYLVLPIHHKVSEKKAEQIGNLINKYI